MHPIWRYELEGDEFTLMTVGGDEPFRGSAEECAARVRGFYPGVVTIASPTSILLHLHDDGSTVQPMEIVTMRAVQG